MFNLDPQAPTNEMQKETLANRANKAQILGTKLSKWTLFFTILVSCITIYFAWKTTKIAIETENNRETIDQLKKIAEVDSLSLTNLNNAVTGLNTIAQVDTLVLKKSQESIDKLKDAVKGIIALDSEAVDNNKKLQLETNKLIEQTNLLETSVEINNKILLRNMHADTTQFLVASYDLEDIFDSVDGNPIIINQFTDNLSILNNLNKNKGFLLEGLRNYCVNDNDSLYTVLNYSLNSIKA